MDFRLYAHVTQIHGWPVCRPLNALVKKIRRARSVEAMREEGRHALERGEYAAALRALEKALRAAPDDPDTVFLAGQANFTLVAHGEALAHFERCIALVPSSADAYCYAGFARLGLGEPAAARVYCEEAFARDPHHVANHDLLAALTLPGQRSGARARSGQRPGI